MKRLCIFLFLLLSHQNAIGYVKTKDVYDACASKATDEIIKEYDKIHCAAYISGFIDAYLVINDIETGTEHICFGGKKVKIREVIDIFVDWVNEHPESRNDPAVKTILFSMINKYPCV